MTAALFALDRRAPRGTAERLVADVGRLARSGAPTPVRLQALGEALDGFVTEARVPDPSTWRDTTGRYTRVLLNSPEDPFQVIVVFWPPGARSGIHDHDESLGAVVSLYGDLEESKFAVVRRDEDTVTLERAARRALRKQTFSPITVEPGEQLHDMVNPTCEWAATVHVYLRRIDTFGVYVPIGDGAWRRALRTLWYDYSEGWERWDQEDRPEVPADVLSGTGRCSCGAVRFVFDAAPAAQLVCHCTDCQRSTGSAMAPLAFFPSASLRRLSGETRCHSQPNDSGHVVSKEFCTSCGTTLFHTSSSSPHLVAALVGVLDDATHFRPTTNLYVGSAPAWPARAASSA